MSTGAPARAASLKHFTDRKITDPAHLADEVERVRNADYAVDDEDLLPGLRCVAVSLREGTTTLGALSVSGGATNLNDPRALAGQLKAEIKECVHWRAAM